MAEEGIVQVFYPEIGANIIVGVVGQLQLDVLISRLEAEYKVEAKLEASPWDTARWIASEDAAALKAFQADHRGAAATDRDRSEEHTSELQSPMRISSAVFCLKKKKTTADTGTARRQSRLARATLM